MVLALPATIKHYTLHAQLGEGHITTVYRAMNQRNGQQVALKVLLDNSPVDKAAAYFENEAAILAQIHYPNIPTFYEYLADDPACLAIGLIEGKDGEGLLAELSEGTFLDVQRVIGWAIQIAEALAYLHDHDPPIVFRDLKPAHVMIDGDDKAWLVDFNLAKVMPPSKLLTDAEAIGTEGFAAPEQYKGTASPLVDVYAFGATFHALLTRIDPRKERPFTYAPLRAVNPDIPKAVAQVIMKALAFEPEDRFPGMLAVCDALKNALAEQAAP